MSRAPASTEPAPAARRIPSLDGLRALSILLVLFGHLAGTQNFAFSFLDHVPTVDLASFGVRVFFVISGFLITRLLFEEHARSGTVSLRGFYLRRTLRIFPAFYVFVAVVLVLDRLGQIALRPGDALAALTYTMNFRPTSARAWEVGHLWSLSVEEQFYLLWPAIVLLARPRGARLAAIAAMILAPLLRVAVHVLAPDLRPLISEMFPTVMDAIATGALLTCVQGDLSRSAAYTRLLRSPLFALVPIFALVILIAGVPRPSFAYPIGETLSNVGIALFVDRAVRFPDTALGRLLDARPLRFLGGLSYSLYLWQQLFLHRKSTATICAFPLNLALAGGCALASYYLVEQPALRLRSRLERKAA